MDATQMISDSILESEEEESEEGNENKRGQPLAKLCILKNKHIPEKELPLFLGDNVLGRDPNTCNLPLEASSVSKQHATICISAYRRKGCDREVDIEALVWDLGSMNGTRKGRLKLTPNVRYALSEQDCLVVADIPCQYVSCAVDEISSRGDATTPVSKTNGVTAKMPAVSGETVIDANRSSKSFVNGGPKSLPEDTRNTPVTHSCLSFEKTPTQPQASLVPESDSDSDGERGEAGERRRKALVSTTESYKSSPTCSTFLSPTNKIVPESEDESPITPSSSSKNRPYRHDSFSKEETYVDVGRQQRKEKESLGVVDDSEEDGGEEERAALAGEKSEESRQHVQVKQDSDVSLTGEDESPVSTTAALTDEIPAFNMDSDTDMEGEETSAAPVSLSTNQKADTVQFHMDSDTDVEEDNDALHKVSKSGLPSADTKRPHFISVVQPEGLTMDSDTDVDDDDGAVSDAKPVSFPSAHTADSSPSTQPEDFRLDSDTDVDEEEEKQCGTNTIGSKRDETPTELDIKPSNPESAPNAPLSVHVDSDTDDETAAVSEPSALSAVTESNATSHKGADLGILSDSDTDMEEESLVIPVAVASLLLSPATKSDAPQPDSDADAGGNDSNPAGEGGNQVDLGLGSDTNVEDKEGVFGNEGEDQIPSLCRENTPGLLVPLLHNCSTPVHMLEGQVEDMDTQAFLSPSTGPFRSAVAHAERLQTLPSLSDSNEDEDYVVAETQSFVLQTREGHGNTLGDPAQAFGLESAADEKGEPSIRAGSFQLGLSDSSHLQGQAQALAMESTQAFVPLEGGVTLEETQPYAANSNTERNSLENDANMEDTQAYAEEEDEEEVARGSVMTEKEGHVNFALEATQAYIPDPNRDSEDETDMDERNSTASAEMQSLDFPTSSTLAMAETQPMTAFEEEESLDEENLVSALAVKPRPLHESEERGEHKEAAQPQELQLSKAMSVSETQPMCTGDNEESDDEDSVIGSRKRKSKQLQIEDEQTQTLTNSELSAVETPPMGAAGDAESDEEDSIPGPRKRKAKRLHIQDEESQTLTNSELSAAGTQPMGTAEDGESDEEDSIPGPRKRKAKRLQIQDEETQPLTNPEDSTVETRPLETDTGLQHHRGQGRQSDAGTSSIAVRGKRATRTRLREEEDQEDCSEPPRRQTRGKHVKALPTTRGRRGKSRPNESEEEEEVEQAKRTRGKKSMRQQEEDEQEKIARERQEQEEQERLQSENAERLRLEVEKAEKERIERERNVQEEKQRSESEKAEREKERLERDKLERMEKEEKEQAERAQKEKEQLERERKEQAEKEKIKLENEQREEQERLERENKDKIEKEKERKEREEKERLETAKRELEERLARERNERKEKVEREKQEKEAKEKQIKEREENKTESPARSRRSARKTIAAIFTTQDSNDVPARRTRSRSNSSNSVSSERSASSVKAQESRGRGRGRGAKRTNETPPAASARSSNRRKTVAAGPTQHDSADVSPQGVLSRSNSTNSLNAEISSCSSASQSRGRGGRQRGRGRGRGRKLEADSVVDQSPAPKPTGRGRKSRKGDESTNEIPDEDDKEKTVSQTSTTRGRQQANINVSESAAADEEGPSIQSATEEESPLPKRNVSGRVQKLVNNESVESPVGPALSDGDEAKRKGRKRELEENTADPSSSCKMWKGKEKAEEEAKVVTNDEIPVQAKRRGRPSSAQAKMNAKGSSTEMEVTEEKTEEETVKRKGRGRKSAVQDKRKEQQDESGSSVDQDANMEAYEPQTPTSSVSRKRHAPLDSSPVVKTPRSSSASPAAGGRSRSASQTYKVLFTGVVDEAGERVLARLGGGMAKGVADMNCLVTDKVRRTVKFLCAVAKGVPIVTTHWLEKSGKAGSFLSPHAFIVKDPEQEKKFSFCLQESLRTASCQRLFQGYEIHVTKSVKPEPVHMKDIISCSGATFLPKMPSSHKPQTLVISCEEDLSLCGPALAASLPVVTAEFILTGILQQKLDLQTHSISAPASNLPTAGGRGRGRRKT